MAILTLLLTVLAFPVAFIVWNAQSLAKSREKAKATGLPYLERWVNPHNPFWLLYGSSIVRFLERFGLASETVSLIYPFGWEAKARSRVHEFVGSDVFIVVSPGDIQVCVADSEVIYDILQRRNDFKRNLEAFKIVDVYGSNLSTTDGEDWQRHRKMTGVTFTEKNNELVWRESLKQAEGKPHIFRHYIW